VSSPPPTSHAGRNVAIGCGGLIAAIITLSIIGSLSNGKSQGGGSSQDQTQNQAASSPLPSPSPVVLLDKPGSGINKTQEFTAAGDWQIDWSYDCANFGQNGNFQIFVYNSDGSLADLAANELGAKGSDTSYEHQGGTFYLQMNSECNWHVIVKG
jgi:hypothetical protein